MKKLLLFSLFLTSLPFGAVWGYIQVEPTVTEINVPPGGSYAGKVQVKNMTQGRLAVSGKLMGWAYENGQGAKRYAPPGTLPTCCGQAFRFSPADFELEPGASQEVLFSLAPSTGAKGGCYSMILFGASGIKKEKEKDEKASGVSVSVALHMSMIVSGEFEGTQIVKGVLTVFEPVNPKAGRPLDIRAKFKNTGNVRVVAKGRLSITNEKGNSIGWTKFPDIKTLPGEEWESTATWAAGLNAGKYKLVGTFDLGSGQFLIEEREIIVP